MRVVWVVDKKYSGYAKISIESFKKWNRPCWCVVISEEPLPKDIGYDENIVMNLRGWNFKTKGDGDRISKAAYLKLFLTKLLYSKILYVDADTICQKPLDELWEIPCKYINLCESHKYGKKQAEALGLGKYGLTGMMMMNLDNLREIDFTNKCLDVQSQEIPSEWWQHDETCINLGMKGLLNFIDKKFNYCFDREYDDPIPYDDAYILHFVGKDKGRMVGTLHYPELYLMKPDIEGKRVAIVGNAKSIFDLNYGKEIDDHDFIIRFNRGFIEKPESQGTNTTFLITAANLNDEELGRYNAKYTANRSSNYTSNTDFVINNRERCIMANALGAQPSTGFMAVNICLSYKAKSIDLYGFCGNSSPTFYNPLDYKTEHNYDKEQDILKGYESVGLLKIH